MKPIATIANRNEFVRKPVQSMTQLPADERRRRDELGTLETERSLELWHATSQHQQRLPGPGRR